MNEEPRKAVLPPPLPHLAGGPPPRLLTNRPYLWFVLAEGLSGVALWSYFLAIVGEATSGSMRARGSSGSSSRRSRSSSSQPPPPSARWPTGGARCA